MNEPKKIESANEATSTEPLVEPKVAKDSELADDAMDGVVGAGIRVQLDGVAGAGSTRASSNGTSSSDV